QLVAAGGSPAYSIIALVLLATATLIFLKEVGADPVRIAYVGDSDLDHLRSRL
ncbi:hypothetical protein Pgy4_32696, partial [Pseudomonas savastanoi pv. glycinea str. race 4]